MNQDYSGTEDWDRLVAITAGLEAHYLDTDSLWDGSPFAWIKARSSRQIGAIGERLVAGLFKYAGFNVERSPDSEADRVVNSRRVEIKFSTLWQNGGYRFQQIRDQDYEVAVCLGVSPQEAHMWLFSKTLLREHVIGQSGQHGGRAARDTDWIHIRPDAPPLWTREWGGTLQAGMVVAQNVLG